MTSQAASCFLAIIALCEAVGAQGGGGNPQWVAAWEFPATAPAEAPAATASGPTTTSAAALTSPAKPFNNVTVRQIVRLSCDAERLRIRISNEFGTHVMRIGAVHIARWAHDGDSIPDSDHTVTFSGDTTFDVVPHAPAVSDPVKWKIPAFTRLVVSVYLPDKVIPPAHRTWEYVSSAGNFVAAQHMEQARILRSGALVSEIDVQSPDANRTAVLFGDSITEGFGSTLNSFRSWGDLLGERLHVLRKTRRWSVVSAGINSNRLLHDTPGSNALARFDRDVLSVPSVAAVILLEGINDIGYSHLHPEESITSNAMIAAYRQLIARAHARGIEIIAGTLTPFADSHYFDLSGEQLRQEVNAWIRQSDAFDGVIDFDSVLRDPSHPSYVQNDLQLGDHLHPNDAGYAAMANAVNPEIFTRDIPSRHK